MNPVVNIEPVKIHPKPMMQWQIACDFFSAASLFIDHRSLPQTSPVSYELLCISIELVFKAYILSTNNIPKPHHNIINHLKRANELEFGRFVSFDEMQISILKKASRYYRQSPSDISYVYAEYEHFVNLFGKNRRFFFGNQLEKLRKYDPPDLTDFRNIAEHVIKNDALKQCILSSAQQGQ